MRQFAVAFAVLGLVSAPAYAAPCRDAKGHFAKCPTAAASKMTTGITKDKNGKCHLANGKFTKCPK